MIIVEDGMLVTEGGEEVGSEEDSGRSASTSVSCSKSNIPSLYVSTVEEANCD